MISDLPRDLAERVLSRLPVTSLGGVRSTCKTGELYQKTGFLQRGTSVKQKQQQRRGRSFRW
uniref:F-box domain-containing protein n=1 Tax=Brassica oleracea TaxID=3712 RepID=A0A3P6DWC1_BRAOL|nr:unnamed protein product [Brassica oleracea]